MSEVFSEAKKKLAKYPDPFGDVQEETNPFEEKQVTEFINPFGNEKLEKEEYINPFEEEIHDEKYINPFEENEYTNPFEDEHEHDNPFEADEIKNILKKLKEFNDEEKIEKTTGHLEPSESSSLTTQEKNIAITLSALPTEQIAVLSSLLPNITSEKKEEIAILATSIQNKVPVNDDLREKMYLSWMQALKPILWFATKLIISFMVTIIISAVVLQSVSFWFILSQIWAHLGWQGLSLLGNVATNMTYAIGTDIALPTGFSYLIRKNDTISGLFRKKVVWNSKARNIMKKFKIPERLLDSTFEDLSRAGLSNASSIYKMANIQTFVLQKAIGYSVSAGIGLASSGKKGLANAKESISSLMKQGKPVTSNVIRSVQNVIATIPDRVQVTISRLEKNKDLNTKNADENLIIGKVVEEHLDDITEKIIDNALVKEVDEQSMLRVLEEQHVLEQQEIKRKVIQVKAAAAVTGIATTIAAALIAGQIDKEAYVQAADILLKSSSSLGSSALFSIGTITSYIGTTLDDSPLIRKLVFSSILSKVGLPGVITKFGKFLTVNQIERLSSIHDLLSKPLGREDNSLMKSFFDVLLGRYYTHKELEKMTNEELQSVLRQNNVKLGSDTSSDTLRKMIANTQKDKQTVTYKMVTEAMIDQVGGTVATLYLESHVVENMWNNRDILINVANDPKMIPLFDSTSEYYISPEQRDAFNIMMKSKEFLEKHVKQGAGAMYQSATQGVESMASISLEKINKYMNFLGTQGKLVATESVSTTTGPDEITEAFNTLETTSDKLLDPEDEKLELDLLESKERRKISSIKTETVLAEMKLEDAMEESDAYKNKIQLRRARQDAVERALERYEKRTGLKAEKISDIGETVSSLNSEIIALLPSKLEYDKQAYLLELQKDMLKNSAELHKEQTRAEAKEKIELHKQQVKLESAAREVELVRERLVDAQNKHEAVLKAKQKLNDRIQKQSVSTVDKMIVGEKIGIIKIPDGSIINDAKVMEALKGYEFTPLLRKTARMAASHAPNWIPGIGYVNTAINSINNIGDVAEGSRDLTNLLLKINTATSPEEGSLRNYLPEQLPRVFNWIPSWRIPTIENIGIMFPDLPKIKMYDVMFDATVITAAKGGSTTDLCLEIAKQIAGSEDVDKIQNIAEKLTGILFKDQI